MSETQADSHALAECLGAVFPGPDSVDREAGLTRLAEFVNRVCSAITPKK